ncbi:MAG: PorT family protein [Dysgonamonadaceae bacterium]|jgi:hypothetical protein|nr:PorT family protein [Dysgonamonadaceae bacterium]
MMKKSINILACTILLFVCSINIKAQILEYSVELGVNAGGSMPVPFPNEIREIQKWQPEWFAPHIAMETLYKFNDRFGIAVQMAFDRKGFTVVSRVKSMYSEIKTEGGVLNTGNFTGKNTMRVQNSYLSIPVFAVICYNRWKSGLGLYAAYCTHASFKGKADDGYIRIGNPTGEQIEIQSAHFDFSQNINRPDFGLLLFTRRQCSRNLAITVEAGCGLSAVFSSEFSALPFGMRNICIMTGINYSVSVN